MTRDEALKALGASGEPFELQQITALGRSVRAFVNAPPTLRHLFADNRSDKPFLVYEDEHLTYEQVWQQSCALAHALVQDYDVQVGDRVAISMRNYPEWVIAFTAATSIGAIAVAMNALWQPHEMEYGLKDSAPKVLFADQERLERLAGCHEQPQGLAVISVRAAAGSATPIQEVLARHPAADMPAQTAGPDDDAIMLYTSGSTGHPKGAVSTHRNVISALFSWEMDTKAGIMTGNLPEPPVEPPPQGAMLLGIPLFHVSGLHVALLSSYRAQRRLVSMYKWDADRAAELIERERITAFTAPAAMTGDLVRIAATTRHDLSSLATVGGGGASRAPEQVHAIAKSFANARPNTGWGMTETNAIGTGIIGDDYIAHPASSGRCSPVLDIRVVDDLGNDLGRGPRGELQIRGTSIMRGYWQRPDANAETFDGEWMRTGDVATIDDEGYLVIVDRIKDLVIRGGENIGCGTVEAALLEHPDIIEASVYGVPDERLGEELGATLYAARPVDEQDLRAFLAPRLARFEIPRYVHFADEPLPRIASGKILKRQLRDEAAKRLSGA